MKNYTILLVYTTLLVAALITPLSAFASSSSDDDSDEDSDVSCSPVTGNPYQEKCGETETHCNNVIGCTVTAPEDTETHTPRVPINVG